MINPSHPGELLDACQEHLENYWALPVVDYGEDEMLVLRSCAIALSLSLSLTLCRGLLESSTASVKSLFNLILWIELVFY